MGLASVWLHIVPSNREPHDVNACCYRTKVMNRFLRGCDLMIFNYKSKLSSNRVRPTTVKRNRNIDNFYSDRSRILYSSSFRRLQQKAQVFSLEPNASVRTRLTHSLEVSDIGRTLANEIAYRLSAKKCLSDTNIPVVVAIVENACLLHDIGNPPFGHFGESAIRDWARHRAIKAKPENVNNNEVLQSLMADFIEFDGNPQGFRTITKLHTDYDKFSLNLTYATLLCALKYSRAAGEEAGSGILKKAGYFQTEKSLVEKIYREVGMELHHRHPLTYIMEAADDIAYCMSDIADGIEKRIITEEQFVNEFKREWKKKYPNESIPVDLPKLEDLHGFNRDISVPWTKAAMQQAVDNYLVNHQAVYSGSAPELISSDCPVGKVLGTIKKVSRSVLYTSIEAESIELTGYSVITGILKKYERLLKLPYADFSHIAQGEYVDNTDVERRLFNRIGLRYVKAYGYAIEELKCDDPNFLEKEWWLRIHLLIDHVSGMTDEFALETYQMLEGINLLRT